MQKAVAWLQQARRNDPLHLMPNTSPGDNERITGHVTGHNFWALIGLKNVITIANALGRTEDARGYQAEYDDLRAAFIAALKKATRRSRWIHTSRVGCLGRSGLGQYAVGLSRADPGSGRSDGDRDPQRNARQVSRRHHDLR